MKGKTVNFTDQRRIKKQDKFMQCGILDQIMEQKKNISEKTGEV